MSLKPIVLFKILKYSIIIVYSFYWYWLNISWYESMVSQAAYFKTNFANITNDIRDNMKYCIYIIRSDFLRYIKRNNSTYDICPLIGWFFKFLRFFVTVAANASLVDAPLGRPWELSTERVLYLHSTKF